ncbi:hypothetical protein FJT64_016044 [Amphibalanus amphitrite]|uniref:Uncharacterized protein n=1 Tax=Amphibalanus amphitrite TaxID=1232801 RepID=A0A6A4X281_AMPAM|nr:hypothetical protein FJT64_016044 [Amphibalanus amphitrite]
MIRDSSGRRLSGCRGRLHSGVAAATHTLVITMVITTIPLVLFNEVRLRFEKLDLMSKRGLFQSPLSLLKLSLQLASLSLL